MVNLLGNKGLVRNKKASALDLVFIAIGITIFGVATLLAFKIVSEFNDKIQVDSNIPTEAKTSTSTLLSDYSGIIDKSALFLAVGLAIGAFILASLVRVHPIFIPLYIIILVFIIFFCGIYSNIYQEMAANAQLTTQADQLVFISYILNYLPVIVGVLGTILMIVMYKLWSNAEMM